MATPPVPSDDQPSNNSSEQNISNNEGVSIGQAAGSVYKDCTINNNYNSSPNHQRDIESAPVEQTPPVISLKPPEGTMEADSAFYIERVEDRRALQYLESNGCCILTIRGARQMGKSSLLTRTIAKARQDQKKVAFLDFGTIGKDALSNADLFYRRFCELVAEDLPIESRVSDWWHKNQPFSNPDRCTQYVRDYLLKELDSSIFLAIDNVDKLIDSTFRDDFFGMLRRWHGESAFKPLWKRFDLLLVTSTDPYRLVQNLKQSPFNVVEPIILKDFQPQEVDDLNRRYGSKFTESQLKTLMGWVGGHPYLVHRALYLVASGEMNVTTLFRTARTDRGPFHSHLNNRLRKIEEDKKLIEGMRQVIRSGMCESSVFRRLEAAGLVQRVQMNPDSLNEQFPSNPLEAAQKLLWQSWDSVRAGFQKEAGSSSQEVQAEPRYRLYAEYFKEHLL